MNNTINLSQFNDVVRAERVGLHIMRVTINRPSAGNAINGDVARALDYIVKMVDKDPAIRVAILTGEGKSVFCAGADLKEIAAGRVDDLKTPDGGFAGFVNARRRKVWIASLNGLALAGGCELMLACDLVVAVQGAELALPEVKRGLMALAGGLYRLPRALPRALALEMIITGERLSVDRAFQHGLINRLAPADRLEADTLSLAELICENAPIAVQESLQIARRSYELTEEELNALGTQARARLLRTDDFKEGPRAFIEKRKPIWTGRYADEDELDKN